VAQDIFRFCAVFDDEFSGLKELDLIGKRKCGLGISHGKTRQVRMCLDGGSEAWRVCCNDYTEGFPHSSLFFHR
jgi:hypothetical protein